MKNWWVLPFFIFSLGTSVAFSQESAPGDEPEFEVVPPPDVPDDLGIGDTSIGDDEDLGAPDSLDGLDVPLPEIQAMPEFEDLPTENATESAETPVSPPPTEESETVDPGFVPETPESLQADEPDFRRERNYHGIYKRYNEDPTPVDQWEQAANDRRSEVYRVQRGDTLWDLSQTFFGQSDYWPKIWALNKDEVYNPHEIDTWMQIRFFPGSMMDAPTLAVGEAPQALAAGEDGPAGDAALIPPPKRRTPLVRSLPQSLPNYRTAQVREPVTNFSGLVPPAPLRRPNAALAYYVQDRELTAVGKIEEAELGGLTAAEYQYVFVRLNDASPRIFSVVREVGNVNHAGQKGRVIEVQGEVEIIESAGEGLYKAIVRRNLTPIEVGAQLIPGQIESVNTQDGVPVPGPSLRVVGAQFSSGRTMIDAEGLVFLSGGQSQGVQVGQLFGIYAERNLRVPKSNVTMNRSLIGHLRIVKVADHFSTGFVTRLMSEVLIGDLVGLGGEASASLGGSSDEFDLDSDNGVMDAPMEDGGETEFDSEFDLDSDDGEELTL